MATTPTDPMSAELLKRQQAQNSLTPMPSPNTGLSGQTINYTVDPPSNNSSMLNTSPLGLAGAATKSGGGPVGGGVPPTTPIPNVTTEPVTGGTQPGPAAGGDWTTGPPPPGYTGTWPPPLQPGQSYGTAPGSIVNGPGYTPDPNNPLPGKATPPPGGSPPGTPGTGGTWSPGGTGGVPDPKLDKTNYGGGWNDPVLGQDPDALALKQAFAKGLTGQAAIDWVNQNVPGSAGKIAWYGDKNTYGDPNWYAAPNGAGGPLDLIKRTPESGPASGPPKPTDFKVGQSYKQGDVPGLVQYSPNGAGGTPIYTDGKGHYFKPDPSNPGQGLYIGTSPDGGPGVTGGPGGNPGPTTPPGGPTTPPGGPGGPGTLPPITPIPAPTPVPYLPSKGLPAPTPGAPAPYVPPTAASGMAATVPGGPPSVDASAITKGATPLTGQAGALFDQLMSRANESLAVNPNDPIIKGQTDAARVQADRSKSSYLSQLAEKGGPNTNISAETRAASEAEGTQLSSLQAGLMQNELAARRVEIQNALSQAGATLSDQQRMQMQEELATIQAKEQQYQFQQGQTQQAQQFKTTTDTQNAQFGASLTEQQRQYDATYGQGAWEFKQAQNQQASQFAATMGLDYATLSENDRQFVMQLIQRASEFGILQKDFNSPLGAGSGGA